MPKFWAVVRLQRKQGVRSFGAIKSESVLVHTEL